MADAPKETLYWFDPKIEAAVVLASCSSPNFWSRLGSEIDPECLNIPSATLAMRAARQIATDNDKGPEGIAIVLQRLRRWMGEGKVKFDDITGVQEFFLDAASEDPISEDALVKELAPVLKRRIRQAVVRKAMEEFPKDEDVPGEAPFVEVTALIAKATTLGDVRVPDVGIKVGVGSYEAMEALRQHEKFGTGIEDLDMLLGGGSPRGGFTVWLGGTNSGKSMQLMHRCAYGARLGMFCALATLELPIEYQLARFKANLTGIPIDEVLEDPRLAEKRLSRMSTGPMYVQTFTGNATTFPEIREWVAILERREKRPLDFLAIDYGDLLIAPPSAGKDNESGYLVGKHVFGAMRVYAEGEKSPRDGGHPGGPIWVDTASAANRTKDKRKRLGNEDVADSAHKTRRATLVVSINRQDDDEDIEFWVSKNTYGKARFGVGPLPTDLACGRMGPMQGV